MTQQQRAFYEIERPVRFDYIVAVQADETTGHVLAGCMYPGCKDEDGHDDVYQCDVCGGWYCYDHIRFNPVCYCCQALPSAIQKEIIAFRERLNALR